MAFWAYMLKCAHGRYYAGHTDCLERRIGQHQAGGYCKFTSTRRPVELVWFEYFPTRLEALEAERIVGGWSRAKKEALIAGDWKRIGYFAKPPRERGRDGVSTSARRAEACPERLPWQAVEGLDTNGGESACPRPFASSEVEKPTSSVVENPGLHP